MSFPVRRGGSVQPVAATQEDRIFTHLGIATMVMPPIVGRLSEPAHGVGDLACILNERSEARPSRDYLKGRTRATGLLRVLVLHIRDEKIPAGRQAVERNVPSDGYMRNRDRVRLVDAVSG